MHERLLEMGRSLPGVQTSASRMRETYTKEKGVEEETAAAQSSVSGQLGDRDTPDTSEQGGPTGKCIYFLRRVSNCPSNVL